MLLLLYCVSHCLRTVSTLYFVSTPDCLLDWTTIYIGRKIVCVIKWCVAIYFPQFYSRSQTELYEDRSAFSRGQCAWTKPEYIACISLQVPTFYGVFEAFDRVDWSYYLFKTLLNKSLWVILQWFIFGRYLTL